MSHFQDNAQDAEPRSNELLDALSWRLLLPLVDAPRVLSIMPSGSDHLDALATQFGKVTSLEPGQAPMSRSGSQHADGTDRIQSVDGNIVAIPFEANSFDLVVVNRLVARTDPGMTRAGARTGEESLVQDLHRVLAPGGCVCLLTRNRWDYRQLLAKSGEGTLGNLGRLRSLVRGHHRVSSHFLSPAKYRRCLRRAGFTDVNVYVAFPDCNTPRFVVPFRGGAYRYFRRHFTYPEGKGLGKTVARLIASSGLDRHIESHLLITGVKCGP